MIGFRIQDVVTIRYMNRSKLVEGRYAYILNCYKLIPRDNSPKSMLKPERRNT